MHKADYFAIPHSVDRLSIEDPDWNEHYMEVGTTTSLRFVFEARFDEKGEQLIDVRIAEVELPDLTQ